MADSHYKKFSIGFTMDCLRRLFIICSAGLLTACASSSVFNPYPGQANKYREAVANNTITETSEKLSSKSKDADALLYLSERGRLNQLNKDYKSSKTDFEKVIGIYDDLEARANISASSIAANASTMLTNDNAIPYEGFGYERIFAHQFQAFNYMALGDLEGANVELRRASEEQRTLEVAHEKEINQAETDASSNKIESKDWEGSPELSGMNKLTAGVKNSFQNAYTFYMSAVLWEAQGDYNNALIDYKKALEINPNNHQITEDISRVDKGQHISPNESSLVVLFEDGWVPAKQSFNLSIPYFSATDVTYLSLAFPYYSSHQWPTAHTLTLYNNHHSLGETQMIANVGAMAVKALKEKVPAMVVRQILRARTKYETNKLASKNAGLVGSLISTIYNIVSEQADLRSWLTLPNDAQILRATLASGMQDIELNVNGISQTIQVEMRPGRTTLLRVINVDNRFFIETYKL